MRQETQEVSVAVNAEVNWNSTVVHSFCARNVQILQTTYRVAVRDVASRDFYRVFRILMEES